MKGVQVSSLLVVLGFVLISAQDEVIDVKISGLAVILTCPFPGTVQWYKNNVSETNQNQKDYVIQNYTSEHHGWYFCADITNKAHIYIRARVCAYCYDLDIALIVGCLVGDVLVTFGVILIVYLCSRSKPGPATPQRATHTRQTGAPPPPDPDYQPLNQATRSHDVYSEAKRKY